MKNFDPKAVLESEGLKPHTPALSDFFVMDP